MKKIFRSTCFHIFIITLFLLFCESVDFNDVIEACLEQGPNHSGPSVSCYVEEHSSISCQGLAYMDRCEKASWNLARNSHTIEIGHDKEQFTLENGSLCYSPRPSGEFPPETQILALNFQTTLAFVGYFDTVDLLYGCVYSNPNLSANELAKTKCCVGISPKYDYSKTGFNTAVRVFPYSLEENDSKTREWYMLDQIEVVTSEGYKLGKINLTSTKEAEERRGGKTEVNMATTTISDFGQGTPTSEITENRGGKSESGMATTTIPGSGQETATSEVTKEKAKAGEEGSGGYSLVATFFFAFMALIVFVFGVVPMLHFVFTLIKIAYTRMTKKCRHRLKKDQKTI